MIKTLTNQVIALAGLSQAVHLVQQIARQGTADREDMETALASILRIDADDVPSVYGGMERIATGLRQLEKQMDGPGRVDPEQARYASILIFLENRLMQQPAMAETLGIQVGKAAEAAEAEGVLGEEAIRILADAYQQTISQLKPRIVVVGERIYLSDPDNGQRIRALLLAGIRSAVLWRQCGGSRWKLLLFRGRMQREARRLLASL